MTNSGLTNSHRSLDRSTLGIMASRLLIPNFMWNTTGGFRQICHLSGQPRGISKRNPVAATLSFFLLSLALFGCLAASAVDPLPANRKAAGVGWGGLVGVPGGIPKRTTIFTNIPAGSMTTTIIQACLDQCPSNQVVQLAAGTYSLGSLTITRNGVTLRGAGPNSTIINCSSYFCIGQPSAWWNEFQTPVAGNHRDWTAGYAQGTTTITVSSTAGMTVGNLLFMDQVNDADTTAYSPVNPDGPYVTGEYTSVAHPLLGYDRIQFQMNRIKSISGNQITLTEPLYMPNWNASLLPQVWFETTPRVIEMSGIEDLAIRTGGGSGGIYLQYTYGCWAKNNDISIGTTAHIGYIFQVMCVRSEVRHNYLHDTGVADRYGIHTRMVGGTLVEDNIINAHSTMLMVNGVSGSVYAYNYGTNLDQNSGFMVQGLLTHGGTPNMCLFEGNRTPQFGLDNQWNNSSYLVSFRNRHVGKDDLGIATGNMQAVAIMATNRHASVIGDVLGKSGVNTWYQDDGTTSCHDGSRVFYLGLESGGNGCSGSYDPLVAATLVRAFNWTSATTTNGGIVADGYTSADLPSSYYLSSKPAYFGSLKWPPIDPTYPAYSDSQTNIPAGYRFVYGVDPATGPANLSPIAVINASATLVATNVLINFSSAGSSDPEGASLTYLWNFGDGSTSVSANPTHAYTTNGTFGVQLNISDGVNTTTTNISITVHLVGVNLPPSATASTTSPKSGVTPLTVTFSSAGSSDPEGATLTYHWNFGDGTTSTLANPSKTYNATGSFVASLTVSDGTNTSTPSSVTITVGTPGSGLVAAYGFEEGSGTSVSDASGNANAGTVSGATWSTGGRFGNALRFGAGAMVTVNDSTSLDLSAGMTLEAWVNPTSISASWADIIYKATDVYFLMGSTPQGQAPAVGGTFAANISGSVLPVNTWSHLAATYDGSVLRLYANGLLIASRPQTGAIQTSTGLLSIGGDASGQNWNGMIDEVRIYNRALAPQEIHNDMNTPVVGTVSKPAAPSNLRVAAQ